MRRPNFFGLWLIIVSVLLIVAVGAVAAAEPSHFTVVLLPDTQVYTRLHPEMYPAQTRWIKDHVESDNIKFVIHLGDIVDDYDSRQQWEVADRAHRILDGVVPYSVLPGNHDMGKGRDTTLYNKYFGPDRFKLEPWYGGHAGMVNNKFRFLDDRFTWHSLPKDFGEVNNNSFCFFEGGGMKFMVLSLEYTPTDRTLQWANRIINLHKDYRAIVAVHCYLERGGGRRKEARYVDVAPGGNSGEEIWSKFVRKHKNIFMVVCGHIGVAHQVSVNDSGGKVLEIMSDYQELPRGGDGWLQTLRFVPGEDKIYVQAYSPVLNKYNKDPEHTFSLDYDMGKDKSSDEDVTPAVDLSKQPGIVKVGFIYDKRPTPQCHSPTIVWSGRGLVGSWMGGIREAHPDAGIWLARHDGRAWSQAVEVANGKQPDGKRYPCWNTVLFQPRTGPKAGPLLLFYKVGPVPSKWWGMMKTSNDGGRTWSDARRLPDGFLGPTKNKPIQLPGGDLLCPSSSEQHGRWQVHFERTADLGKTWQRIGPIDDGKTFAALQPTILTHSDGRLQALCRSRQNKIVQSWSDDGGRTWSKLTATMLPNPNSGIDAVTLSDGRHLLVYNPTTTPPKGFAGPRTPLGVAVSDDGKQWKAALVLEDRPRGYSFTDAGEYSYPAVIQTPDGMVHVVYTWRRLRIKHVVINPAKLVPREMPGGNWP